MSKLFGIVSMTTVADVIKAPTDEKTHLGPSIQLSTIGSK